MKVPFSARFFVEPVTYCKLPPVTLTETLPDVLVVWPAALVAETVVAPLKVVFTLTLDSIPYSPLAIMMLYFTTSPQVAETLLA